MDSRPQRLPHRLNRLCSFCQRISEIRSTERAAVLALARREPKDGDMTANGICLPAVVAPTGVGLLRKSIQACVLVGVGDLSRQKFLVA